LKIIRKISLLVWQVWFFFGQWEKVKDINEARPSYRTGQASLLLFSNENEENTYKC